MWTIKRAELVLPSYHALDLLNGLDHEVALRFRYTAFEFYVLNSHGLHTTTVDFLLTLAHESVRHKVNGDYSHRRGVSSLVDPLLAALLDHLQTRFGSNYSTQPSELSQGVVGSSVGFGTALMIT